MYRVIRDSEIYHFNFDCEFEIIECDEKQSKIIAYFTSLYDAMKYCESHTQTVNFNLGDSAELYVFCIDKMLVDENGAFTQTDENFICKLYSDSVKYIGEK